MRFSTPLRYPGGKAKFAPFVKDLMEVNNLSGDYLEPFAGGAGVALDLLYSGYCKNIHINDFDLAVYSFWKAVTSNTEEFLRVLYQTPVTIDEWYKQKAIFDNPMNHSDIEHGFAAFFLNRTNRSGILKGGVIGGKNQDGRYKLDARFHKANLTKRIEKIDSSDEGPRNYNCISCGQTHSTAFIVTLVLHITSKVGWGKERTPTLCHGAEEMQCDTGP